MAGHSGELISRLRAAGGEHVQEVAPEVIDLDVLRGWCEREERILRLQYEGGRLPDPYEAEAAMLPLTNTTNAMKRWALIKHLYRLRSERLAPAPKTKGAELEDTVRKILRREPVVIELLGRLVKVTSRSYGAMVEIHRASLTIDQLEEDLRLAAGMELKLRDERRETPLLEFGRRNALRRRIRELRELAVQIRIEQQWHRMSIYAHALTPSGAPSVDVQRDAPEWWEEMGPAEDAALLKALWQAGPVRYSELGLPPIVNGKNKIAPNEQFGWANLFALWEPKMGLRPGELYNRDLVQLLVQLRARATTAADD